MFSERGPLGHSDRPRIEALRVLRTGGRIFVETGAWGGSGRTVLTKLAEERKRFERLGVRLEILASRLEEQRFKDIYTSFEMQCTIARYFEKEAPFSITDEAELRDMTVDVGGDDRQLVRNYHTIWIGGQKV